MSLAPVDVEPAIPEPAACTNCGFEKVDTFCARCGEKQPDHHDVTVGHFFHELLHELLHVDSKLCRTLRVVVTRPGELTAEYFGGRKTRYVRPLRLFITLFALQLIAYTVYQPVAVYSVSNLIKMNPNPNAAKAFTKLAARKKVTVDQVIEKIDAKWQKNMSLLQLFNLLGAALVLKILYRSKRHFGEHLVFSAHYLAFSYIYSLLIWPVYLMTGLAIGVWMIVVAIFNSVLMAFYLCVAIRRYYGQSLEKSIAKGILAYIGTLLVSIVVMQAAVIIAIVQVAKA